MDLRHNLRHKDTAQGKTLKKRAESRTASGRLCSLSLIVLLITDFLVFEIYLGKMSEGRSFLGSAEVDGHVFMIGGFLTEEVRVPDGYTLPRNQPVLSSPS